MMLSIRNKSDTLIIILHEIYGMNQHIRLICDCFGMDGYDVICPDLINRKEAFLYDQEEEAYQYFIENIGIESAFQKVEKLIMQRRKQYKYVFLVGYSIGATIAWLCSRENNMCDGIIGYYGSRIRDYVDITPKCPVLLFFPAIEKSFNVERLVDSLEKINIDIHVLKGEHGFSDPFSGNYCEPSYRNTKKLTDNFINKIKNKSNKCNSC